MKRFISIAIFLLISVIVIQAQVKVTFDEMEADRVRFYDTFYRVKIKTLPDSDTHFQVIKIDNEGDSTIFSYYSKKEKNIKIKKLEELISKGQIVLDGESIVMTKGEKYKNYRVYKNGELISNKKMDRDFLFSETIYNPRKKVSLETVYYPSGVVWATIIENFSNNQINVMEYYESGNVKRREQIKDGILVKEEHYTSAGQDTLFALPFIRKAYFPGGEKRLLQFVSNNLRYPAGALGGRISGRVIVRFVIDTTGKIKDSEILRHVYPDLDEEAIRIVKLMPKWGPGIQYGEITDTYYILPILFKLYN
jgi:TonB family protein